MFGVGGVGRKMRTWPRFEKKRKKKDTQSSMRTTVSHPPPPPQSLKPDDGLAPWRRAVMALLWARWHAIRGGFFCSARRRRQKEKNGRNRASFLPLTSVCIVPCEPLIARLLRTLAKVARVSAACFPDSSNNPPTPTPPAINRNNRIHVELCVKAPASFCPLKIVFF